jgi:hypothetical protein
MFIPMCKAATCLDTPVISRRCCGQQLWQSASHVLVPLMLGVLLQDQQALPAQDAPRSREHLPEQEAHALPPQRPPQPAKGDGKQLLQPACCSN